MLQTNPEIDHIVVEATELVLTSFSLVLTVDTI